MALEFAAAVVTVLNVVKSSIELIDRIKIWYQRDAQVAKQLADLKKKYVHLKGRLERLQRMYAELESDFDNNSRPEISEKLKEMETTVKGAETKLCGINKTRGQTTKCKRRFKAKSQSEVLTKLCTEIADTNTPLDIQFNLLSSAAFVKEKVEIVNRNQKKVGDDVKKNQEQVGDRVVKQNKRNLARFKKHIQCHQVDDHFKKNEKQKDRFRSSFDVPSNPDHVRLCYRVRGKDQPDCFEARLKAAVLRDTAADSAELLYATTCVQGMSGTGKSCAARGLAGDADIKKRFRGGVYFISLGKDANKGKVASELQNILLNSGGRQAVEDIEKLDLDHVSLSAIVEKVTCHFKRGLDNKLDHHCLFVIDDLSNESNLGIEILRDLASLAKCSKNSHVVCTTTCTLIACHAKQVSFEPLDWNGKRAQEILLCAAGLKKSELKEDAKQDMKKILTICSGLPVALAIGGRAVRRFTFGTEKNEKLRDKAWGKYLNVYNRNAPEMIGQCRIEGYPGLNKNLSASLRILKCTWKETVCLQIPLPVSTMFRSLCVLRKREWISVDVLRKLWKLQKDDEAELVATSFAEMNLLTINKRKAGVFSYSGESASYSRKTIILVQLHDLVHEFACVLTRAKQESIESWHKHLLDKMLPRDAEYKERGLRKWWKCDLAMVQVYGEEGCGCKFDVEYHLKRAGLESELSLLRKKREWRSRPQVQSTDQGIQLKHAKFRLSIIKGSRPIIQLHQTYLPEVESTDKGMQLKLGKFRLSIKGSTRPILINVFKNPG